MEGDHHKDNEQQQQQATLSQHEEIHLLSMKSLIKVQLPVLCLLMEHMLKQQLSQVMEP
jgi:hypothetical protein